MCRKPVRRSLDGDREDAPDDEAVVPAERLLVGGHQAPLHAPQGLDQPPEEVVREHETAKEGMYGVRCLINSVLLVGLTLIVAVGV